ncbi:Triple Functional Domain Protein [Manis pentadactyla]|nr:Triple Functional Domain Protein [Manis pentadactyla]
MIISNNKNKWGVGLAAAGGEEAGLALPRRPGARLRRARVGPAGNLERIPGCAAAAAAAARGCACERASGRAGECAGIGSRGVEAGRPRLPDASATRSILAPGASGRAEEAEAERLSRAEARARTLRAQRCSAPGRPDRGRGTPLARPLVRSRGKAHRQPAPPPPVLGRPRGRGGQGALPAWADRLPRTPHDGASRPPGGADLPPPPPPRPAGQAGPGRASPRVFVGSAEGKPRSSAASLAPGPARGGPFPAALPSTRSPAGAPPRGPGGPCGRRRASPALPCGRSAPRGARPDAGDARRPGPLRVPRGFPSQPQGASWGVEVKGSSHRNSQFTPRFGGGA